jgi:hypothetical protein
LALYHWTANTFEAFAKGDIGFHFGTYKAAYDRREGKTEAKRGADIANNREILANALESAVKSDEELEKLQEYRYHKKGLTPRCQSLNFMRIFLPCL